MVFWNGERRRIGSGPGDPEFVIHFRTRTAWIRTVLQTSLGFGESYVKREVEVEGDLETALCGLVEHGLRVGRLQGKFSGFVRRTLARTLPQEKADVEHHYGRGNEFYEFYLDRKLQYSCGYFRTPGDSLDLAQEQKIAHTVRKLDLRPGQRLLDIGCGWGHLMFHAAEEYGVECLGITLSDNQAAYIREQVKARRLPVEVRVMNYLELDAAEPWERIVTVGMMCHVGERRADAFYDKLKALSAPGGIVLTHCISKMVEATGADSFVEKHVFPGYWFFSLQGETNRAVERGFNVLDVENLRRHYALTAHHWRRNFNRNYEAIKAKMGFDDRFMRTWDFYLAIVVGGFRSGYLNLIQMTMANGVNDGYPLTREFQYPYEQQGPEASSVRSAV
jgi:cyclopropane-fatty-acyl-phospholipid synthase